MRNTLTFWHTDTPTYEADDLSGAGANATGGRWNPAGVAVVCTTRALACLETVVHLNAGGLPLNRYLVEVTVPDDIWADAQTTTPASLLIGWDAEPQGGQASSSARTGCAPADPYSSSSLGDRSGGILYPHQPAALRRRADQGREGP
ncbi:MAG: RES family NAD+ phosphorylase [Acetobacteraceae bacterium]|nr:RES family NAD+ phosphorylase [Acetobacteraceae bacterium]